jgi:hypothetical protein
VRAKRGDVCFLINDTGARTGWGGQACAPPLLTVGNCIPPSTGAEHLSLLLLLPKVCGEGRTLLLLLPKVCGEGRTPTACAQPPSRVVAVSSWSGQWSADEKIGGGFRLLSTTSDNVSAMLWVSPDAYH